MSLLNNLLKRKSPDELLAATQKTELKKTLNVFDLMVIGIGAVAMGGGSTEHAPNELVACVAAHGEEPEFGFDPMHGWGYHDSGTDPLIQSTILKRNADNEFVTIENEDEINIYDEKEENVGLAALLSAFGLDLKD